MDEQGREAHSAAPTQRALAAQRWQPQRVRQEPGMVREATEAAQLNRYVGDQPSSEYHELRTRLSLRELDNSERTSGQ